MVETPERTSEGAGGVDRPLLEVRGVSKRFGGVQAVAAVSLAVGRGQIHGLVGENGAGKSTLAKIMGGAYQPDEGEVLVDGEPTRFHSPRDALAAGVAMIAQEIALVPARTVLENVFLGIESRRLSVVHTRDLRRRFAVLNERTGFRLDPDELVTRLRVAEQQKAEIMRAIARDARLILMDEPTASLTADETERLLEIVRRLAAGGTSIVLVSHFLDEVLAVADTVSVMRDGRLVRTSPAGNETRESLVQAMIGREVDLTFPEKAPPPADAPVVLEARGVTRRGALEDVSFSIRAGEIVGLAGLVGSGRSEIARAIFGADRVDSGEVLVDGKSAKIHGPRDAVRIGIAMLPESRKDQGLLMIRSVRENETLPALAEFASLGVVRTLRERAFARELSARLDVRTPSIDTPVISLSGGNQQKVLFAKWLARPPLILIADEPTRGVDVSAKAQIHHLIAQLAAEGMGVLLISSEIEEVIGLAHRVLVMRGGRVVGEFAGDDVTRDAVMRAAFAPDGEAAGGRAA